MHKLSLPLSLSLSALLFGCSPNKDSETISDSAADSSSDTTAATDSGESPEGDAFAADAGLIRAPGTGMVGDFHSLNLGRVFGQTEEGFRLNAGTFTASFEGPEVLLKDNKQNDHVALRFSAWGRGKDLNPVAEKALQSSPDSDGVRRRLESDFGDLTHWWQASRQRAAPPQMQNFSDISNYFLF